MDEYKKVTYRDLKKDQKIGGYILENRITSITAYIKDITPAYVSVDKWRHGGEVEKNDSRSLFLVPMSEDEIKKNIIKQPRK